VINLLLNVVGLIMVPSAALEAFIAVQTIGFIVVIVPVVLPAARRAFAST